MEDNKEKQIEKMVDDVMQNAPLHVVSDDFTASLMQKIELEKQGLEIQYQPLISRKAWLLIVAGLITLIALSFNLNGNQWIDFEKAINFNEFSLIDVLADLPIKMKNLVIIFLATFVLIQLPLLKYYLDQRLEG